MQSLVLFTNNLQTYNLPQLLKIKTFNAMLSHQIWGYM